MKCILCDLEIPKGKESVEHYCCKHRFPAHIWNNPKNKFWSFYLLNAIKSDYLPCEWAQLKINLTYNALKKWNIKQEEDKNFLMLAIQQWETNWNKNPCDLCLAHCNNKER